MTGLPTGTVTFLFTDIEGSTKLWERDPKAMSKTLSRHDELLRKAVEARGGFVFKTVGDAFYVAFSTAPEAEEIRRLHTEYFLALAEQGASELRGSEEARWLERLETEHDNMRAALSWALQSEEVELGLRLAGALWRFWDMRGYYGEGRRWLEEALGKDGTASEARAKALEAVGWLADVQGDIDRAVAVAEEGLSSSARATIRSNVRLTVGEADMGCGAG